MMGGQSGTDWCLAQVVDSVQEEDVELMVCQNSRVRSEQ